MLLLPSREPSSVLGQKGEVLAIHRSHTRLRAGKGSDLQSGMLLLQRKDTTALHQHRNFQPQDLPVHCK